jgi:hypothetical protein
VIDHEGEPISGLVLAAKVGSARADSVTDASGIASFTVPVQPDAASVWIWPVDDVPRRREGANTTQPEPNREILSSYAFDRVTQFDLDELADGPLTIRVSESVQCMLRVYVPGVSSGIFIQEGLQSRGGPCLKWSRPDKGSYFGGGGERPYIGSSLPIARHQPAQIAVTAQGRFYLVELDAEQTARSVLLVDIDNVDDVPLNGEIWCPLDDDTKVIRICLIPVDGNHAREVWLTRVRVRTESDQTKPPQARAMVPSGDYFVFPMNRHGMYWERDTFGLDLWSPGSVFDTMLRLRRAEDLPHLKRITIPEGGTVELSTEDFIDPPAHTPPQTDPR